MGVTLLSLVFNSGHSPHRNSHSPTEIPLQPTICKPLCWGASYRLSTNDCRHSPLSTPCSCLATSVCCYRYADCKHPGLSLIIRFWRLLSKSTSVDTDSLRWWDYGFAAIAFDHLDSACSLQLSWWSDIGKGKVIEHRQRIDT